MNTEYLKLLIADIKQQSASNRARLSAIKADTYAFKQNVSALHREIIQAENRFIELTTGIEYDTPVRNINPIENTWKKTGSY